MGEFKKEPKSVAEPMQALMAELAGHVPEVQGEEAVKVAEAMLKVEWFDDRYYRRIFPDSNLFAFYPSSTTILNIINAPFLARWRGDLGNYEADRRMNYAAWRGSRIHDALAEFLVNGTLKLKDEFSKPRFLQEEWLQLCRIAIFLKRFNPTVIASEMQVFSDSQEFAGTLDMLVKLEKGTYKVTDNISVKVPETGLYVGDLKTGKSIDADHHLQIASYAYALTEMGMGPIVGTFILHTNAQNKSGFNVYIQNANEWAANFGLFQYAMKLWRWKNPNDAPKVFSMPEELTYTAKEGK